jgi:transposase-like protein
MADNLFHDGRKTHLPMSSRESTDLIKKGHSGGGKQHYICKHCGPGGLVNASKAWHGEAEQILMPILSRSSMRGICRIFKVSRPTLVKWLKKPQCANLP